MAGHPKESILKVLSDKVEDVVKRTRDVFLLRHEEGCQRVKMNPPPILPIFHRLQGETSRK